MENDVLYNRIMNVVHEEYGSGSTATANPEGEATDALEKIQIGDDIYSISGGGSNGPLIIETIYNDDSITLSCTFNEFKSAVLAGKKLLEYFPAEDELPAMYEDLYLASMEETNDSYQVTLLLWSSPLWAVKEYKGSDKTTPMILYDGE